MEDPLDHEGRALSLHCALRGDRGELLRVSCDPKRGRSENQPDAEETVLSFPCPKPVLAHAQVGWKCGFTGLGTTRPTARAFVVVLHRAHSGLQR